MKRLTETGKWFDAWFEQLPTEYRLAWLYALDQCNMAGVMEASVKHMCYAIGCQFTAEQFIEKMAGRVVHAGRGKWFIPKFIVFQYGHSLKRSSNVHKSVIKKLYDDGIDFEICVDNQLFPNAAASLGLPLGYPSPRVGPTPKDKDTDKDKAKDKDMDKNKAMDNTIDKEMEEALGF